MPWCINIICLDYSRGKLITQQVFYQYLFTKAIIVGSSPAANYWVHPFAFIWGNICLDKCEVYLSQFLQSLAVRWYAYWIALVQFFNVLLFLICIQLLYFIMAEAHHHWFQLMFRAQCHTWEWKHAYYVAFFSAIVLLVNVGVVQLMDDDPPLSLFQSSLICSLLPSHLNHTILVLRTKTVSFSLILEYKDTILAQ